MSRARNPSGSCADAGAAISSASDAHARKAGTPLRLNMAAKSPLSFFEVFGTAAVGGPQLENCHHPQGAFRTVSFSFDERDSSPFPEGTTSPAYAKMPP